MNNYYYGFRHVPAMHLLAVLVNTLHAAQDHLMHASVLLQR
jgi:hypothetical protein